MNEKIRNITISTLLGIAIIFSWLQPLDSAATAQVDAGLKRSLASFAVARALNAAISVAQGTEVSVQMVAGVTFTPGEALDPVNDIVEQFGDLMLAASVAFGIMHFLIQIGSFWLFSLTLSVAAIAWIVLSWKKMVVPAWLPKVIVVLLLVRFSIPIMTVGSDFVFKEFLAPKYATSQDGIQIGTGEVTTISKDFDTAKTQATPAEEVAVPVEAVEEAAPVEDSPEGKAGFISKAKNYVSNGFHKLKEKSSAAKQKVVETIDFRERIKHLEESAGRLVTNIVNLIAIFVLQTIIVPAVILWILYLLGLFTIRSISDKCKNISA